MRGLFARLAARSRGDVAGAVRAVVPSWYAPPIAAPLETETETETDVGAPPAVAETAVGAPDARPTRTATPDARAAAHAAPPGVDRPVAVTAVPVAAPAPPLADIRGNRAPAAVRPALPGRAAPRHPATSADPSPIERAALRTGAVEPDAPLVPWRREPAPPRLAEPMPPRVAEPAPPSSPPAAREREAPLVTGEPRRAAELPQVEARAVVRVTIGRIDVRAVTAPSVTGHTRPPPRPAAGVGLADYLGRRDRGER